MIELSPNASVDSAMIATSNGRESAQAKLPSFREFSAKVFNISPGERVLQTLELVHDVGKAVNRFCDLRTDLKDPGFLDSEERFRGKVALLNMGGLFTWTGSKFLKQIMPFGDMGFFDSHYAQSDSYFVGVGAEVDEVMPESAWQFGDLVKSRKRLEDKIERKLDAGYEVGVVCHSFGGIVAQNLAVHNFELAKHITIFLGASELPTKKLNYLVGGAVLLIQGPGNYKELVATSEFIHAPQAGEVRFVNIVSKPDPVLRGATAPGIVHDTRVGHCGIYQDRENLRSVVSDMNDFRDRKVRQRKFSNLMRDSAVIAQAA